MYCGKFASLFCFLFLIIFTKDVYYATSAIAKNVEAISRKEGQIILKVHNEIRNRLANGDFGNPMIGDMSLMNLDDNLSREAQRIMNSEDLNNFENITSQLREGIASFDIISISLFPKVRNDLFEDLEGMMNTWILAFMNPRFSCDKDVAMCKNIKQILYSKSNRMGCAKRERLVHIVQYLCLYDKRFDNSTHLYQLGIPCSSCQEHQQMCDSQSLCASRDQCYKTKTELPCSIRKVMEYHVATHKMSFDVAHSYCKAKNMQLPKIENSYTNTYIYDLAKYYYVGDYWINGNDIEKEGVYVNTDNVKLTYTNWHTTQRDNSSNADCINVKMDAKGQWNELLCNSKLNVICQPIKIKEYHIGTDKMTFEAADCYCKGMDMQLSKIENSYTNTYIYNLAKHHSISDYWINGNDKEKEGVFVNTNNMILRYTNWNPDQPDNSAYENCIHVKMDANGQWNDLVCNSERNVICQPKEIDEYHVATSEMTFEDAQSYCYQKDMQLPKIENSYTNTYIYLWAKHHNVSDYWINGNDIDQEGVYVNSDNVKLNYTNWYPNKPGKLGNEDCIHVKINANGIWNDLPCNYVRSVICQPIENEKYHIAKDTMTFDAAHSYCKANDMQLPKIENSYTNAYIYGLAKYHYIGDYWINGNDKEKEGVYVNSDNVKLRYTNWYRNEPDNMGSENCIHVKMDANGRWNDLPCTSERNVICQPLENPYDNLKMTTMASCENDPICCKNLKRLCNLPNVMKICPNTCDIPYNLKMTTKASTEGTANDGRPLCSSIRP